MTNKYLLDTNILVYLVHNKDLINKDIFDKILDSKAQLYTNSICIGEFIHLSKLGKIEKTLNISQKIESLNIKILQITKKDFDCYEKIDFTLNDNKDPNDHQILTQAIARDIELISSDRKFSDYKIYGLKLLFNNKPQIKQTQSNGNFSVAFVCFG